MSHVLHPTRKLRDGTSVEVLCMSIAMFCAMNSIGKNTYYKLQASGRGPREIRVGSKVSIAAEDAAEWRRSEAERNFVADAVIVAERAARHKRAVAAGVAAAKSPRHVSQRSRMP